MLVAAVVLTIGARLWVPALQGLTQEAAAAERPPDDDHYLANDVGGQVDHHVLWFGIDAEVVRRLKAAQVLFVGNSRLMFGLRPALLRPFFADRGVRYYVMGFGYREADRFPLEMIRRFDLRPRLVVVNADGFFGGGLSPWADLVNRDTPFAARKLQLEAEAAHEARRVVHQLVPNWFRLFGLPGLGLRRHFIAYRSRSDGTWTISPWAEGTAGFVDPEPAGPQLGRGEVAAAQAFKAELDAPWRRDGPDPRPVPRADARGRAGALRRAARRPAGAGGRARPDLLRPQPPQRGQRPRLDARPARHAGAARRHGGRVAPAAAGVVNFVSWAFVALLTVTFFARLTIGRRKIERAYVAVLLVASAVFYGWHVPPYLLLLVGTALLDFGVALAIDRVPLEQKAVRRRWLLVSLISNLGVLGLFKYGDFAARAIEDLAALAGGNLRLGGLGLILPMGISFYTFQTLSYTIDVYRGELSAVRAFPRFLLFVSFFPQLVAGPIVRASEFLPQMDRPRRLRLRVFYEASWLLIAGFFLKMVCADNLAAYLEEHWDRGARPGTTRHLRAVAGADVLGTDLRRLLRLLDHRARPRLPVRLPLPDQLRRARTSPAPSRTSGSAGTSRCRAGCATTSTCRSAATAARSRGRWPTC